jgi:hypothetical protein
MHRFLNWCLKLEYNPDGRRLKGYKKASALEADWKYFRVYYTKVTKQEMSNEMGVAVRTVCSIRPGSLDPVSISMSSDLAGRE